MAGLDLAAIKFTVDTTELKNAVQELDKLKTAAAAVGKNVKSSTNETESANRKTKTFTRTVNESTNALKKHSDIYAFMAQGFSKGQSSVLAMAKASGATTKELEELKKVLDGIFNLAGKNPFDDSADPVKKLRGELKGLSQQMKVLNGETSLTVKQLEMINLTRRRALERGKQQGLSGSDLRNFARDAVKEAVSLAEEVNKKELERNKLLELRSQQSKKQIDDLRNSGKLVDEISKKEFTNSMRQLGLTKQQANELFKMRKLGADNSYIESQTKQLITQNNVAKGLQTAFAGIRKEQEQVAKVQDGLTKGILGAVKVTEKETTGKVKAGLNIAFNSLKSINDGISKGIETLYAAEQKQIKSIQDGISKGISALNKQQESIYKEISNRQLKKYLVEQDGLTKSQANDIVRLKNKQVESSYIQQQIREYQQLNAANATQSRSQIQNQRTILTEQQKINLELEKTRRVSELKKEGFSTTSSNKIFQMEKRGASAADLDAFKALRRELDEYNKKTGIAAQVTEGLSTKFVGLQGVVRALLPGFGALSAGAISATAFKKIIDVADAYGMLQSRLKLTGADAEQLGIINERLLRISNESRTSLTENTQLYVKLANALKNFGGTSVDALNVTSAFSKALVIGGANTKEAAAATLQFAQALGSGKLAGDEFRSIAEASPRVLQAIADGTGKTTGELKKLASEGFLTTATVTKALISQLAVLELEMASLPPTVGQAFQVLSNNTVQFIGELDKATGFTRSLAEGILNIANSIPSVDSVINGFTEGVRGLGKLLQENKQFIAEFVLAAASIAVPFVINTTVTYGSIAAMYALSTAMKVGAAVATTYRGVMLAVALAGGGLTGVLTLLATALKAINALMIRNPIGLAITTVSLGLATLFGDDISAAVQKLTDKLSNFNLELGKTAEIKPLTGKDLERQLQEAIQENIKTKKLLGKELTKEEKSQEKQSSMLYLKDTREFVNQQMKSLNLMKEQGKISDEQYERDARNIVALAEQKKLKQELAETSVRDKPVELKDNFNLSNISKVYEARLTAENQLQTQQRRLIDSNLQYRLISEGQAFVQRENLARESYNRELDILLAFRKKIANAPLSGDEQQQKNQSEQKKAELDKLDIKISQLKTERDMNVEFAKQVALGQANERSLVAQEKLGRLNADIQQDITALLIEQANQYKDPAVIAAEQAKIKAADKYTETLAKQENTLKFLQDALKESASSEDTLLLVEEIKKQEEIILRLKEAQTKAGQDLYDVTLKIRKENQSLEAGFERAFASFRNEIQDISRISENFTRGFFKELDDVFSNVFSSGKLKFGKLFKFIREEIKKIALQQLVLQPIKVLIEPVFKDISSSVIQSVTGSSAGGASSSGGILTGLSSGLGTIATKAGEFFGSTAAAEFGRGLQGVELLSGPEADLAANAAGVKAGAFIQTAGNVLGALAAIKTVIDSNAPVGAAAGAAIGASFGGGVGAAIGAKLGEVADELVGLSKALGVRAGETRSGQSYRLEGSEITLPVSPSGGAIADDVLRAATKSTVDNINSTLAKLGSSATVVGFLSGLESSGKGRGGVFSGGTLSSGKTFGETRNIGGVGGFESSSPTTLDSEQAFKEYIKDLNQVFLQALKAESDSFESNIKNYLESLGDIEALNESQLGEAALIVEQLNTINKTFKNFAFEGLRELANAAADTVKKFFTAIEGIEGLQQRLNFFYEEFTSEEQKFQDLTNGLVSVFSKVGAQLPKTRDEFVKYFKTVGTDAFVLISEALPVIDKYYDSIESGTDKIKNSQDELDAANQAVDAANQAVDAAKDALQRSIDAERERLQLIIDAEEKAKNAVKEAYERQKSELETTIAKFKDFSKSIKDLRKELSNKVFGGSVEVARSSFNDVINRVLSGDESAFSDVGSSANDFLDNLRESSKDYLSFVRGFAEVQNKLLQVEGFADTTASVAEKQLDELKTQVSKFIELNTRMLSVDESIKNLKEVSLRADSARQELLNLNNIQNELLGTINSSVLSVAEAVKVLSSAKAQQGISQNTANIASGNFSAVTNDDDVQLVQKLYQDIGGRAADPEGLSFYVGQLKSGDKTPQQVVADLVYAKETLGDKFATGGAFTNGIVSRPTKFNIGEMGERGSEAIMPLANIGGSLGVRAVGMGDNSALLERIESLTKEVSMLRQENIAGQSAIAANTGKTSRILDRVSQNGESFSVMVETE